MGVQLERPDIDTDVADAAVEVRNISFSYGLVQVLFDVSLRVERGERVALLGTNGAGKSTVLNVVAGLAAPTAGTVWMDGDDVTNAPPHGRAERGVLLVPGGKAVFPTLTVEENLRMAAYPFIRDRSLVAERLEAAFERLPQLQRLRSQRAGTLSGGEQQLMALGRALVARPSVLLIDELSLGLAPVWMQDILALVDDIVADGTTLLVVEQSLNVAAAITERAYFMEKGEIRFSGATGDLLEKDDIARAVFFGDGTR